MPSAGGYIIKGSEEKYVIKQGICRHILYFQASSIVELNNCTCAVLRHGAAHRKNVDYVDIILESRNYVVSGVTLKDEEINT